MPRERQNIGRARRRHVASTIHRRLAASSGIVDWRFLTPGIAPWKLIRPHQSVFHAQLRLAPGTIKEPRARDVFCRDDEIHAYGRRCRMGAGCASKFLLRSSSMITRTRRTHSGRQMNVTILEYSSSSSRLDFWASLGTRGTTSKPSCDRRDRPARGEQRAWLVCDHPAQASGRRRAAPR